MSNPTELPDLDKLEALVREYSNTPIHSAKRSKRTVMAEIHELFARRAQPEGEAPQAAPLSEVQIDRIARAYFSEQWAVQHAKDAIHDAFEDARKSASLSPLCGAQHAESGKEVAVPGWEQRINAVAPALRVKTKDQAMEAEITAWRALAAQQAAAPAVQPVQEQASTTRVTETKRAQLEARGYEVVGYVMQNSVNELCTLAHGHVEWLGKGTTSAPGTPEAPSEPEETPIVTNRRAPAKLEIGDYVFASRWSDCDPGEPWAVGHVSEIGDGFVVIGEVTQRRFPCAMRITTEQGSSITAHYPGMEKNYQPRNYRAIARVFECAAQLDGGQEGSESNG